MGYKPQAGESVRALLVSALGLPAEAFATGIPDTVEGIVLSVNEAKGTIVVKDDDGDWNCLAAGAFPLPAVRIITAPVSGGAGGGWQASFAGRDSSVAYGATEDEAAQKLKFHFSSAQEGS